MTRFKTGSAWDSGSNEINELVDKLSDFVKTDLYENFDTRIEFQAQRGNYPGFWNKDWDQLLKSGLISDPDWLINHFWHTHGSFVI